VQVMTAGQLKTHVRMRVREAERFAVSVMSQLRLDGGVTIDVLICNLSSRGFMLNSPDYIPVDAAVHLVVPGIGPCEAQVIWSFCGDTGGCFTKPIEIERYWAAISKDDGTKPTAAEPVTPSQHLGQYFERGAERINAEGTFGLKSDASDYSVDAEICDISTLGLKGACDDALAIGSLVTVDIPGIGPVDAEVKWQLAGVFGAMFLEPIDLKRCEWSAVKARFS
jgi:hypothetical protein